ncbi:MAG TPA: DUF1007 family protein [Aquabacterium sp.]|nr:DUF1007 family protein [Aquabacterium sp.]HQC99325.1 DUF1007 family protein [Aquabacterium sp.]
MRLRPGHRLLVLAGLCGAAAAAVAHPHGRLDCQVQIDAGPAGLRGIDLRLALDAASSASLLPRLQLPEGGGPATTKDGRQFAELVAGMFRQSGWMLKLQALGADGEPTGTALDLADPAPALFSRTADGLVTVAVRLQPEAPAAAPHGWALACQDPSWYWATGFAGAAQFSATPGCKADLQAMRDMAEQAKALQAAAQRAGVPGADTAAPGLLQGSGVRAMAGTVRCPAP